MWTSQSPADSGKCLDSIFRTFSAVHVCHLFAFLKKDKLFLCRLGWGRRSVLCDLVFYSRCSWVKLTWPDTKLVTCLRLGRLFFLLFLSSSVLVQPSKAYGFLCVTSQRYVFMRHTQAHTGSCLQTGWVEVMWCPKCLRWMCFWVVTVYPVHRLKIRFKHSKF